MKTNTPHPPLEDALRGMGGRGGQGTRAWSNLLPHLAPERITAKPREQGLTMVLDRCHGLYATEDLLTLTGDAIDQIKLSFGTSIFLDETFLRRKIELIRAWDIDIYPGGTLMEATLAQGVYPHYVKRAKELGFTALEISDGTITMSRQIRDEAIKRALDAGLKVITEVGKKDPAIHLSPPEIGDQIAGDLAVGADKVIVEARESGLGVGIYDENGALREAEMKAIVNYLGDSRGDVIWEAPLQKQQAALIVRCGPNVNLGNIRPNDVLGLEALRCGLRFETFRHRVQGSGVQGSGFGVQSSEFGGLGFGVPGSELGTQNPELRIKNSELGARNSEQGKGG